MQINMHLCKSINKSQFGPMKYYISTILFLLFLSFVSQSEPLIPDPKFSRLSTENGLSQDTVNSLLLDSEGFLWVGTQEGLNRFDGYQNQQVNGPNNEFNDVPISHLFQDSTLSMVYINITSKVIQPNSLSI
jgi:ligand-binding sensor domain-containing protein